MKTKFILVGSGTLAGIIAGACADGRLPSYELAAILGVEQNQTEALAKKAGCHAIYDIEEALALQPHLIVEAAAVGAVRAYLLPALQSGINFLPLSIGAFSDAAFYEEAQRLATENGVKIYLPSGAIGGYDVLRAITAMGQAAGDLVMEFSMNKSRVNMEGTRLYDKCPEEGEPAVIFEGNAAQAIELLPGHVNVAVAASLATIGPEKMKVVIYSDPTDPEDEMHSRIRTGKASAHLIIRSVPPDIAAWSVISMLNNLASPVQFA